MNHHEENNDVRNTTDEGYVDDDCFIDLLQKYGPVFFELEDISRVLGTEHPTVRLMTDATESLDEDKLEAAQAAFDALPEQVLNRARYPWVGCPPPLGTRDKLRELLVPELEYEFENLKCAYCYL
jgi:hypothetical protein